ncbi:hypothetical protein GCM10010365_56820 [Streptomyces poonensis]|uniref:Uncharacterized protein n=1 Tax=Streptomyces poonensis TaxID=68255 RepID=A0A918URX3_9ACTN|nr:hypothetical protein GCM10010365_56820 [Streptomyces poonensis]
MSRGWGRPGAEGPARYEGLERVKWARAGARVEWVRAMASAELAEAVRPFPMRWVRTLCIRMRWVRIRTAPVPWRGESGRRRGVPRR